MVDLMVGKMVVQKAEWRVEYWAWMMVDCWAASRAGLMVDSSVHSMAV